jgi:NAD(P)-dependent dehydrogenase (short-subunit alcohol dehydrogenase family)
VTVLVTGGSRGIGLAVGRELAVRGEDVVLVARGADALENAAAALPGHGHRWYAFDVTDDDAWEKVALDELRGLVLAAAVLTPIGPVGSYLPSAFSRTLVVNVVGLVAAVHHCLPALERGNGSIVTFSGGGGSAPLPRYDAYAASKAAVVRLTENLSIELAPMPVNCIAPGFVATDMHRATLEAGAEAVGPDYYARTRGELEAGGFPVSEAAELACMLLAGVPFSGKLISAQWDPWRDPSFHQRLAADDDLGTLRRVDGVLVKRVTEQA